jgi:hypothetical protein
MLKVSVSYEELFQVKKLPVPNLCPQFGSYYRSKVQRRIQFLDVELELSCY